MSEEATPENPEATPESPEATAPPAAPAEASPAAPAGEIPQEERTFGMLAHLCAFSGILIPFGNIVGPLVIWLIKKDTMPFVDEQGKEALNFQITITIAMLICSALIIVIIGLLLLPIVGILAIIFTIIGAVKANSGEHYRYPFALRLIN
ncbi:MAG: DUF4870 domain-containing protein [Planctomycetota bacterium]